jgi:1-acyl-sn-glycerol-3-phosphate acyltransferase
MIRTVLTLLAVFFGTIALAPIVMVAALLRVPEGPGSIYERTMSRWARLLNRVAGVTIVTHGRPATGFPTGAVYIANHVSWFDVFVIAAVLPRYTFIAKAELRRLPIFGRGAVAAGIVFLERDNRKAAFEAYKGAVVQVQRGRNVVVCPEGTRGYDYALRPFKKGPFVLAIDAGAPIVPTVVHGAREVMRKGSFFIRPGVVHVHFLEPVPTAGMTYDDRQSLMHEVWTRMATALRELYGVTSTEKPIARGRASA